MIWQLVAAQAADHGDDSFCKWIIGGLVFAIVAMAGFIVKQFADRISDLKDSVRLASTLEDVVQEERRPR